MKTLLLHGRGPLLPSSRRAPSRHHRSGRPRFRVLRAEPLEQRRLLAAGLAGGRAMEASGQGNGDPDILSMVANSPPQPPMDISNHFVDRGSLPNGAVILGDVPTSRWTYGCTATSAGMIFGYYDRMGYPNMYTGPANGGVCPLTNLGQGDNPAFPIPGSCSIIATQAGFDGRPAGSPGHVDDYWTGYLDPGPDPWETVGVEHAWNGECVADYLGTNQWKWDFRPAGSTDGVTDDNLDGGTQWFAWDDGSRAHDPLPPAGSGLPRTGCAHGMWWFARGRGYTVTANYSQLSDNLHSDGFSFSDLKDEIDQGFPVIIHVEGHTMVAVGYYDADNTIYIHNTWDNDLHWMNWGESYAGMKQLGVTVFHLDPNQRGPLQDFGDAPQSYSTLRGDNGARHTVDPNVHLGWRNDPDSNGQVGQEADGDDREGSPDDEDGVTFLTHLLPGEDAEIEVEASWPGYLSLWIDYGCDGGWRETEDEVFKDLLLDPATNRLNFTVPTSALLDHQTYARFRFSLDGGVSFDGEASDGEVEDYRVLIGLPQIRGTKWDDLNGNGRRDAGEPPLGGWRVYCDLDGDGEWEAGEPFDDTDISGNYTIRDLEPGTYLLREVPQDGWMQTCPGGGTAELDAVTVPSLPGGREGCIAAALPFDIAEYEDISEIRYQQIYAASEFLLAAPGGVPWRQGGFIGEIRFRQDEYGWPFSTSGIDIQINLGYSRRPPTNPSEVFEANITDGHVAGDGYVTVFDGLLDLSSGDTGGPPHLFDIVIDVEDLFYYDPEQGDLLLDMFVRSDAATVPFDAVSIADTDTVARIWSDDLGAERGQIGGLDGRGRPGGLVTQFAFNPQAYTVSVERGRIAEDYDFCNARLGEIKGTKWYDRNRNRVQDGGEEGLENWTVYCDINNNGQRDPDEPYAITDASGDYTIPDLPPGYYIVAEDLPYGWDQLFPVDPQRVLLGLGIDDTWPGGPNAVFDVDLGTGAASGPRRTPLSFATGITRAPDGWLYTINGDGGVPIQNTLYRVNPLSGNTELIGVTGLDGIYEGDLDFDPTTGRLYGACLFAFSDPPKGQLFEVDPATGKAEPIGDAVECDFSAMAFDDAGNLWAVDTWNNDLVTVNKASGDIGARISLSRPLGSSAGMDFDPASGELYLADGGDPPNNLYTVDTASGIMTTVGVTTAEPNGLFGLEFIGGAVGTHVVPVGWGHAVTDIDFGNWTYPLDGQVHGENWNDLDGDGLGPGQEPGLDNWTLYLDLDASGDWQLGEPRTYSNPEGHYSFAGLAQGDYLVAAEPREGWRQTHPSTAPPGLYGVAPWSYPDGSTFLYTIDTEWGQPTQVGETGIRALIGLTAGADGTIYTVSALDDPDGIRHLYTVDPTTGETTALFSLGTTTTLPEGCLEMIPGTDQIYVLTRTHAGQGYAPEALLIDVGDQTLTALGDLWWANGPTTDWSIDGLSFRGDTLYGLTGKRYVGQGPLDFHLVTIDPQTLEIVDVGPLGFEGYGVSGLAYNAQEDVFYATIDAYPYPPLADRLCKVDPITGAAEIIANTGVHSFSGLVYLPGGDHPPGTHLVELDQGAVVAGVNFGHQAIPVVPSDWGDAPEPYPTLPESGGASHPVGDPLYLGSRVDHDPEGQPSEFALGDDLDGEDDEDGLILPDFYREETTTFEVEVTGDGFLYGWFDWNRDGTWQHPDELEIATPVSTGSYLFDVSPAGGALGQSFARFRLSTEANLPPTGPAPDGEVEDYTFMILPVPLDYGDAPEPYPTRYDPVESAGSGARHRLHLGADGFLGPWLGDRPDAERNGQPAPGALGDDYQPPVIGDDEDGVTVEGLTVPVPELMPGLEAIIRAEINAMGEAESCWLGGWIDFDSDHTWQDPDERVVGELIYADGTYEYTFTVPEDAVLGETYARFRVSTEADLLPTGYAADGEVEDHAVQIVPTVLPGVVSYEQSVGQILLEWGDEEELVPMIGRTTIESRYEGPQEGDARDDNNNALDEVEIRILEMTLSGMSSRGPIQARLRDGVDCIGQIEETTDSETGRLDLSPFAETGTATAFFDLFLEWVLPDGMTRLHNEAPLRLEGVLSAQPAGLGDRFAAAPNTAVPLLDREGYLSAITVYGAGYLLNPVTETEVYEYSVGEIVLGQDGQLDESIPLSGSATINVYYDGPNGGDALDDDGDERDEVVAQLVELNLTGGPSDVPTEFRLQEGMTMVGLIEETANVRTDLLDLPPSGPPETTAESFFDAFFEVEVGGQTLYTSEPKRMSSLITSQPLAPGDVYENSEQTPLVDAFGDPAAYYLGYTRLEPNAPAPEVVGRRIFYNNSALDGNDPAADEQDDGAVASDKAAYEADGTATLANYTSYSRGINGIMVDIAGLANPQELNVENLGHYFEFHVGNSDDPADWGSAPTPSDVAVRESPDTQNAKRVTIIWDDYAIRNQWLQVTVLADADYTGLSEPNVFYFGNAVGESGNSELDAEVNDTDVALARDNPHNFFNPATVICAYDYNRDARVNATDMLIARSNPTDSDTALKLIHPQLAPGESPGAEYQGEGTPMPTWFEEEAAAPAIGPDARLGKWAWLYEFEQISTQSRPSQKHNPAEEAVDRLLATYWP